MFADYVVSNWGFEDEGTIIVFQMIEDKIADNTIKAFISAWKRRIVNAED